MCSAILTLSVFVNFMTSQSDHVTYYKHHVIHGMNSILSKFCFVRYNLFMTIGDKLSHPSSQIDVKITLENT